MSLLPQSTLDEHHLRRALALAQQAVGLASPNPTVGCVIARGSEVLGEGAHLYDHFDHAEIVALKQAAASGHSLQGATAYVTLEPCSHHGRTGPCADALIAAGIARCVIATQDPNPQVSGQGIAKLRDANIEVVLTQGPLAQQARTLNDAFAHFIQTGLPFVTLKAALSVDGKLAPPPAQRSTTAPHWLTGEAARADVQQLRHATDAILTGIGTVLADDPELTDRTNLPRRRKLLRIVLDSQLQTQPTARLFLGNQNDLLIACAEAASATRETTLLDLGAEILRLPEKDYRLDLTALLRELAHRKIQSLLLEAGSTLNGAFLREHLVHKVILYYAESELGLNAVPFAEGLASPYVLQQQLTQTTRTTFPSAIGEDIKITGYLQNPWPPTTP